MSDTEEFVPSLASVMEIDSEFLGLVIAYHARRLTARNMVVQYATNMKLAPPLGVGGTSDLIALYEELLFQEAAMETSEDLFELIEFKRLQAQRFIAQVREEDLPQDEAENLVKHAVILTREIEGLTTVMEGMAGA